MTDINEVNGAEESLSTTTKVKEMQEEKEKEVLDEQKPAEEEPLKVAETNEQEEPATNGTEAEPTSDEKVDAVETTKETSDQSDQATNSDTPKVEDKKVEDTHGEAVAKHYNELPEAGKEKRKESRIYHLRNFNNWAKSTLITEYLEKIKRRKRTADDVVILDLACGKGGDLLKWQKGRVDHVIMADIAETSIEQCRQRYTQLESASGRSRNRLFAMEAYAVDCTKERLCEKWKKQDMKVDLTSCQFALHYAFESYDQAAMMIQNACEKLRVGGYWIGTTVDANRLVKGFKSSKEEDGSFGCSLYRATPETKDAFPLFGGKYMFHLEGVVDCPEFLVHFPVIQKLAEKYDMKLVMKRNFHDLYRHYERDYGYLLQRMSALEQFPASGDKALCSDKEDAYQHAAEYIGKKGGKVKHVGTLTKEEWEAAGLYIAFVFEKCAPKSSGDEGSSRGREDRKRTRGDSRDSGRSKDRKDDRRDRDSSNKRRKADEEFQVMDSIECDDDEDQSSKVAKDCTTPSDRPTSTDKTECAAADTTSASPSSEATTTEETVKKAAATSDNVPPAEAEVAKATDDVVAMEATSSETAEPDTTATEVGDTTAEVAVASSSEPAEIEPPSSSDDVASAVSSQNSEHMEADSSADAAVVDSSAKEVE